MRSLSNPMKGPSVGALEMCCEEKEKETRTKDAFEFLTLTIFTTPAHVKQPATFFFFFLRKRKMGGVIATPNRHCNWETSCY